MKKKEMKKDPKMAIIIALKGKEGKGMACKGGKKGGKKGK